MGRFRNDKETLKGGDEQRNVRVCEYERSPCGTALVTAALHPKQTVVYLNSPTLQESLCILLNRDNHFTEMLASY